MEQIVLKGGNVHYTMEDRAVYNVVKGPVLVYLIPVKDGRDGRRLLLGEFDEGNRIPGFYHASKLLGEWKFGIVAMDLAGLIKEDEKADDELLKEFAKSISLVMPVGASGFDEAIIEKYERVAVKEKGYIYAAKREKKRTRERSLGMIYDFFESGRSKAAEAGFTETGRPLYDAAAYICGEEKIHIAPLERITETSGRRFGISDIARVSHFVIREIVLEGDWYKKDTGAVLAFRSVDKRPVACIPKGPRRYVMYDPKAGKTVPLDAKAAAGLRANAYMFYRPFPEKSLSKMDLVRFGMQKVYKGDLVRLFVLAFVGTLIGLLIPYMNEQAYDKFIPMGNSAGLMQLGAVLLACSLGNISFTIVKNLASFRSMNTMEYAVQAATFDRLFNLPESFFRKFDSADLGQRAMAIAQIYDVLAKSVVTSLLSAFFSLLYLWRMFRYSARMSVWALVLLAAVMAFIILMGFRQLKYEKQKMDMDTEIQSITFQNISGISKIRNAWAEDRALMRYLEKFMVSRKLNKTKERYTLIVNTVTGSVSIIFSVVFYFLMIRRNIGLSIGAFSAFTAAFGSFSGAMLTIVQNFLSVNHVKPLYDFARPVLEELPEISEDADMPGTLEGEIDVDNVTFAYDPEEPPVLKDLSLHIKPGEYVGVVGSSGCGKSTLLKLLLGFEKPQRGRIYYDSRDIDELDKRELRKKFGVVLQDGGLISGSIYENITITAPGVKMRRVEETIREVGLEDDIRNMPMGMHTVVSEGAGTISGGQAQRILIARAIVGKPKIIFLDEATSALDNVTQSQVVQTLEGIEATKLVIAHRLSTVQNCDRIIVMDKGQIVEQGTYDELMEMRGLFYELAIRQIS